MIHKKNINLIESTGEHTPVLERFVGNTLDKNLSFYILIAALVNKLDLFLKCAAIWSADTLDTHINYFM